MSISEQDRVSMLGERLAQGRTADVHAWGETQVIKLFHEWEAADRAEQEARLARAVHAAGLPVPAVGDVVYLDGRQGLIYERIHGRPLLADLALWKPWTIRRVARRLAELHAELHAVVCPQELPPVPEKLRDWLRPSPELPEPVRHAALKALASLRDGTAIVHGDFHFLNILNTARGPIIIDWGDSMRGHALADVARTWVTFAALPASAWLDPLARGFAAAYRNRYLELRPGDPEQFRTWCGIFAAARANEGFPRILPRCLALARKYLHVLQG